MNNLPETGYLRLNQIIGSPKSEPPVPAIFPVCSSSWWNGVKQGIYPSPVKLSANVTAWRVENILELIERINNEGAESQERAKPSEKHDEAEDTAA